MTGIGEERFRELLDARGVLRPGALAPPDRSSGFTVFAQREHAALDVSALKTQAARFFDAKIGLTVAKSYGDALPEVDVAHVVLATGSSSGADAGTRLCFGRRAEEADRAAADAAEASQGTTGMALLAQRCGAVWTVTRETADDRVALTIAAILASTLLGPILSPDGDELFGVRTARMKLEGRARPYR